MTALVILMTSLCLAIPVVDASDATYNDGDPQGPATWAKLFPKHCASREQSPIAISEDSMITKVRFADLKFTGFSKDDKPAGTKLKIHNTGQLLYLFSSDSFGHLVSGGGLPGKKYRSMGAFYHWGSKNGRGSEHKLNGKFYDGEVQLLMVDTTRSPFSIKPGQKDVIAGFATMLQVVEDDNPRLNPLIDAVKKMKYMNDEVELADSANLADLVFPDSQGEYFRYYGSFTLPTCQPITWTVWKTPLKISERQLNAFRSLYSNVKFAARKTPLVDNRRPLQPLYGRTIQHHSKPKRKIYGI